MAKPVVPLKSVKALAGRWLAKLRGDRPEHTLVFASQQRLLRVDFNREGQMLGSPIKLDCDCAHADLLPAQLPRILMGLPRPARKLWLLYDNLPFHTMTLSASQVAGLNPEQYRQALTFELEQLTGVAAQNKEVAYSLIGHEADLNHYAICLLPAKLFEQVQKSVRKFGCRLYGLGYAGAAPSPVRRTGEEPWARLEFWRNGVVALHSAAETGTLEITSFHDINPKKLESELERWVTSLSLSEGIEVLITSASMNTPMLGDTPLSLEHADNLEEWLQAWVTAIAAARLPGVPLRRPTVTPEQELQITVGFTAAALAVCLTHFGWFHHEQSVSDAELAKLKHAEQQIKNYNSAIKKQRAKRDEIVKALDTVRGMHVSLPLVLSDLRKRPAELLREVSIQRSDDVVIERISSEGDVVTVVGAALKPASANDFAALLETRMNELGWRISPPEKKDMGLLADGGPWSFSLRLIDTGLAGFNVPANIEK